MGDRGPLKFKLKRNSEFKLGRGRRPGGPRSKSARPEVGPYQAVNWSPYISLDLCGVPSGDWGLVACAPAQ
jgi:hypothetical protein